MTTKQIHLSILGLLVFVLVAFYGFTVMPSLTLGEAKSGTATSQSFATTTSIGPQQVKQIFARNEQCDSRVIRTRGAEIDLIFQDPSNGNISSTTLSDIVGFIQAASTTIAYDSGLYGCGRVFSRAQASTTITIAEFE